jgi:hypothetical protein
MEAPVTVTACLGKPQPLKVKADMTAVAELPHLCIRAAEAKAAEDARRAAEAKAAEDAPAATPNCCRARMSRRRRTDQRKAKAIESSTIGCARGMILT